MCANSLLFVDEEQYVRKALQRSFRNMHNEWEVHFAADPRGGLQQMDRQAMDVLVTEMVFSNGESGFDFMETVRTRHPQTVRIILSGYVDRDVILKTVDLAHQFLSKPCDPDDLKRTIAKAFLIRDLLTRDALKEMVARIDSLPSLPSLYVELVAALKAENSSVQQIGEIVSRDPAITAKLLKLVNSSFFGLPQRVAHPAKAVSLLGLDLVQSIVLASAVFEEHNNLKINRFSIERLWEHAMRTALLAKAVALDLGLNQPDVDTAFMSGLIHDIGKLLIASNMPEDFYTILVHMDDHGCDMATAENRLIGTTHAALGAYLLGLWGLPDDIIHGVAFHHRPSVRPVDRLGTTGIVHLANAFAHARDGIVGTAGTPPGLDWRFIDHLDLGARIADWQNLCSQTAFEDLA